MGVNREVMARSKLKLKAKADRYRSFNDSPALRAGNYDILNSWYYMFRRLPRFSDVLMSEWCDISNEFLGRLCLFVCGCRDFFDVASLMRTYVEWMIGLRPTLVERALLMRICLTLTTWLSDVYNSFLYKIYYKRQEISSHITEF